MKSRNRLVFCLLFLFAEGAAAADPFADVGDAPQLVAPGVISTGDDESHPTLAPDGRTLYFLKNTPDFTFWTLAESRWSDGGGAWGPPRTLPFSGQYADADLALAPDGRTAWFVSRRPVNGQARTDTEIWRITVEADGWGEPQHEAALSSPADEWLPTVTADGTIYFGSARPGGLGGHDIWRARWVDGGFAEPENLGAPVNSTGEEIEAYVDPGGTLLVLAARDRPEDPGLGAYDLYLSQRDDDGRFGAPVNLGAPVNSSGWDFGPRLTPDGRLLLFTSNRRSWRDPLERPIGFDALERRLRSPGNGLRDVYAVRLPQLQGDGTRPKH